MVRDGVYRLFLRRNVAPPATVNQHYAKLLPQSPT